MKTSSQHSSLNFVKRLLQSLVFLGVMGIGNQVLAVDINRYNPDGSSRHVTITENTWTTFQAQGTGGSFFDSLGYISFNTDNVGDAQISKHGSNGLSYTDNCNLAWCTQLTNSVQYKWLQSGIYYVAFTVYRNSSEYLTETWVVTVTEPKGSIEVTINPSSARSDGARFKVDNGLWNSSGTTISNLSVGNHTVSYKSITDWIKPSNTTVSVSANQTTSRTDTYIGDHDPVASRNSPNSPIELNINESKKFDLQCSDEDGDLDYAQISSNGKNTDKDDCNSCSNEAVEEYYSWSSPGEYTVNGYCRDDRGNSDSISWDVEVVDPNNAPSISRINPASSNVTVYREIYQDFRAEATDPDSSNSYNIDYIRLSATGNPSVKTGIGSETNSCQVGCTSHYHTVGYRWNNTGNYTVTALVRDKGGIERSVSWSVTVTNPPVINSIAWNTTGAVNPNISVGITAQTAYISNGTTATIRIYEDDIIDDDLVKTINTTVSNNQIQDSWNTVWQSDVSGLPEFYAKVEVASLSKDSAANLYVKIPTTLEIENYSPSNPVAGQGSINFSVDLDDDASISSLANKTISVIFNGQTKTCETSIVGTCSASGFDLPSSEGSYTVSANFTGDSSLAPSSHSIGINVAEPQNNPPNTPNQPTASNLTHNSVRISGTVPSDPDGDTVTAVVQIVADSSSSCTYSGNTLEDWGLSSGTGYVDISGLSPETRYCAKIVASDGELSSESSDLVFTTLETPLINTQITNFTHPVTASIGDTITLSAKLSRSDNNNIISGKTINFTVANHVDDSDFDGNICSAMTNNSGVASCSWTVPIGVVLGNRAINASFESDSVYNGSNKGLFSNIINFTYANRDVVLDGATYTIPISFTHEVSYTYFAQNIKLNSLAFTPSVEQARKLYQSSLVLGSLKNFDGTIINQKIDNVSNILLQTYNDVKDTAVYEGGAEILANTATSGASGAVFGAIICSWTGPGALACAIVGGAAGAIIGGLSSITSSWIDSSNIVDNASFVANAAQQRLDESKDLSNTIQYELNNINTPYQYTKLEAIYQDYWDMGVKLGVSNKLLKKISFHTINWTEIAVAAGIGILDGASFGLSSVSSLVFEIRDNGLLTNEQKQQLIESTINSVQENFERNNISGYIKVQEIETAFRNLGLQDNQVDRAVTINPTVNKNILDYSITLSNINSSDANGGYIVLNTPDNRIKYFDTTKPDTLSSSYTYSQAGEYIIKAVVRLANGQYLDSVTKSIAITLPQLPEQSEAPTISPNGGTYQDSINVSITTDEDNAHIRYSLDNNTLDCNTGNIYLNQLVVKQSATLRAITCAEGKTDSDTSEANFTINQSPRATLTITISGSGTVNSLYGINCGNDCSQAYNIGSTVTLIANPLNNIFNGWTGDCSGNANPLTIVMDSNKTCGANFIPQIFDTIPDQFNFTSHTDVTPNTVITSNAITISGINTSVAISVSNGQYNINGGIFTNINGVVNNEDNVQVRHSSSGNHNTSVGTVLTVGNVSVTFISTTRAQVNNPTITLTAPNLVNPPAQTYSVGTAISPLSFINNGGSATLCLAYLDLPIGLNINANNGTCVITGTPAIIGSGIYAIIASNTVSYDLASVSIVVNPVMSQNFDGFYTGVATKTTGSNTCAAHSVIDATLTGNVLYGVGYSGGLSYQFSGTRTLNNIMGIDEYGTTFAGSITQIDGYSHIHGHYSYQPDACYGVFHLAQSSGYSDSTTTIKHPQPNFNIGADKTVYLTDTTFTQSSIGVLSTVSNTYASSKSHVATVSSNGEVDIAGVGQTIITAINPGDSTYLSASDTYLLTVYRSEYKQFLVSASSYGSYAGYTAYPSKAVDGDDSTFWCGTSSTSWYQIDFTEQQATREMQVGFYYHTVTGNIQYSKDGSTWITLKNFDTNNSDNSVGLDDSESQTFTLPNGFKSVRINFATTDAPSSHIYKACISEVDFDNSVNRLGSYQNFHVIAHSLTENDNHTTECKTQLGDSARLADWNDIVDFYNNGGSLSAFKTNLRMSVEQQGQIDNQLSSGYRISRNGNEKYSSNRHYFVSRHDHNKPGYYWAHANINNYSLSLGSWYGTGGYALCYQDRSVSTWSSLNGPLDGTRYYDYDKSNSMSNINIITNHTYQSDGDIQILSGDVDGDGISEVVQLEYSGSGFGTVTIFGGTATIEQQFSVLGNRLSALLDVNQDGKLDIGVYHQSLRYDTGKKVDARIYQYDGNQLAYIDSGYTSGDRGIKPMFMADSDQVFVIHDAGYSKSKRGVGVYQINSTTSSTQLNEYQAGPHIIDLAVGDYVALDTFTAHNGHSVNGTTDDHLYFFGVGTNTNAVFNPVNNSNNNGSLHNLWADLDGNGLKRYALEQHGPTYYHGTEQIHLISETGVISSTLDLSVSKGSSFGVGNVDNDDNLEIIVSGFNNSASYIVNSMTDKQSVVIEGYLRIITDVYGDSRDEIITSNGNTLYVYHGYDNGNWLDIKTYNLSGNIRQVVPVDLNDDGYLELVVALDTDQLAFIKIVGTSSQPVITPDPTLQAPSLSISVAQTYSIGTAIMPLSFTNSGGSAMLCFADPSLPNGLNIGIGGDTCVISGTPTTGSSNTIYTIIASNTVGYDMATVSIVFIAPSTETKLPQSNFNIGTDKAVYLTDVNFAQSVVGASSTGATTYTSANTSVATVNKNTGEVGIIGAGTTTITATNLGDSNYLSASDTYVLTVLPNDIYYDLIINQLGGSGAISYSPTPSYGDGYSQFYLEGTTITLTTNPHSGYHFDYFTGCDNGVTVTGSCMVVMNPTQVITAHFSTTTIDYQKVFAVNNGLTPTITPTNTILIAPSTTTLGIYYQVSDDNNTLSGLGLRVHFNANYLSLLSSHPLGNGLISIDSTATLDSTDFDNNSNTTHYINVSWADVSGNWPNTSLATHLLDLVFLPLWSNTSSQTMIGFSHSSSVAGYGFQSQHSNIVLYDRAVIKHSMMQLSVTQTSADNTPIFATITMRDTNGYLTDSGSLTITSNSVSMTIGAMMPITKGIYHTTIQSDIAGISMLSMWLDSQLMASETIIFTAVSYTLNIQTSGTSATISLSDGSICYDSCDYEYLSGTTLSLSAISQATPQYIFYQWSGDCSGIDNPTTITITGDLSCIAHFDLDTDNDGIVNTIDIDDDNDGLPDVYENANGLNSLINDANGDLDGDGFSSIDEYHYNGNPNDDNVIPLYQEVYISDGSVTITAVTTTLGVYYRVSDNDNALSGLGIRTHFDNHMLSFVGISNTLTTGFISANQIPQVDSSDFDSNTNTNRYIGISWANVGGNWPNQTLPIKLFDLYVVATNTMSLGSITMISFSHSSVASSYGFKGDATTLTFNNLNLDIDDNGNTDALTDGLLILRYLFGFRGQTLIRDVVATNAKRKTSVEIEAYLALLVETGTLDIDDNSIADALTDGLLSLRYMFGFREQTLIRDVVANNAKRKTSAQIEAYIRTIILE